MRFTGLVYRAHHPRWAFTPVSGEGAARYGGRFNPPGVAALYTSLRVETAWFEAQQAFPFKAQPMTICDYEVDSVDIVDLTDERAQQEYGISPRDLACAWEDLSSRGLEPPSWRAAKALITAGAAGAVAPSFAPGASLSDHNLVFWRWSDARPNRVVVIDDQARLPRDGRSWEETAGALLPGSDTLHPT